MNGGFLIVDKPKGYTSRDIVNMIGRFLNTQKVGHGGTLDPIATGVLVVAVGDGLKILQFMKGDTKEYIATAKLGILTDTLDVTGNILKKVDNYFLDSVKLHDAIDSFKGKYLQEVPLYSSVKVGGKRLYSYARENKEVILPKREVEIFEIELLDVNHDEFAFRALVSKGTYIRSLIRDIGDKIKIPCTMSNLKRTKQANFTIEDTINLDDIEKGNFKFVPIDKVLSKYHTVVVDDNLERKILNGSILKNSYEDDIVVFKNSKGNVIAIYELYNKDESKIKPIKVFK